MFMEKENPSSFFRSSFQATLSFTFKNALVAWNEKWEKLLGFSFSINIVNFWSISPGQKVVVLTSRVQYELKFARKSSSRISILICTTALFNVIWFFFFCVILRNAIASLVHSVKNALRTMNCLIFGAQHQWYKFLIVKKTSCLFSDYKLRPLLLGFIWWYIRCGGATVTVDFCFAMLLDFL